MDMSFGTFVRTKRLEKVYTLRKFSEAMRLSQTFVSAMQRDEISPPNEEKIREMAEILDVDPDELLLKEAKTPKKPASRPVTGSGCIVCLKTDWNEVAR